MNTLGGLSGYLLYQTCCLFNDCQNWKRYSRKPFLLETFWHMCHFWILKAGNFLTGAFLGGYPYDRIYSGHSCPAFDYAITSVLTFMLAFLVFLKERFDPRNVFSCGNWKYITGKYET